MTDIFPRNNNDLLQARQLAGFLNASSKLAGTRTLRWALIIFSCGVLFPNMPVNCLTISDGDGTLFFSSPLPNGASFITTYVHSVQLTPVVDEYRIVGGKIWVWEERVQSHNAGLPFAAPEHGRFIADYPWMIVQGGRRAERKIAYRVGTEKMGRNTWNLLPFAEVEACKLFPLKRLFIEASIKNFSDAPVKGWKTPEEALNMK